MKRMIRLLFLLLVPCLGFSQVNDVITSQATDFKLSQKNLYTTIESPGSHATTTKVAAPQLPVFSRSYVLPAGSVVTGIDVRNNNKVTIGTNVLIYPVQPECSLEEPCGDFVPHDPVIYDSNDPYPEQTANLTADNNSFGYHMVSISICPFSYIPKTRELALYTQIDIAINYTVGQVDYQLRITERRNEITRDYVRGIVQNPALLSTIQESATEVVPNPVSTDKLYIPWKPSAYGAMPDYIIITNEALKHEFDNFATYKTQRGIPTLLVTTEQIYQAYSGCDDAEKIRNYLKDAHYYWGAGLFVLLGGDIEVIPGRLAPTYYTDLYYSDVFSPGVANYNWNANGNSQFGEQTIYDLGPENFAGRAPADTPEEAHNFISKIMSYESLSGVSQTNYVNNMLFLGAYVGYDQVNHVGTYADTSGQYWHHTLATQPYLSNPLLNKWLVFDDYTGPPHHNFPGNEELNRPTTLDRMSNGLAGIGKFHLISHYDHGSPYGLGVSTSMKGHSIYREDMDALSNGNYYQIMYTTACEDGEFDKDCFAEHYVNATNGGGVAILANTASVSIIGVEQGLTFFQAIYGNLSPTSYLMGAAYTYARFALTGQDFRTKVLTLFGEPSMGIWSATPQAITLTVPSSITIDNAIANILPVTINQLSNDAVVTVYKYNPVTHMPDVYASQTIPAGSTSAQFTLNPDTAGSMIVKVTAHNYLPATANVTILLPQAHLYVTGYHIDDANGNGHVEQGETVTLNINLTNSGNTNITNIQTALSCNPAFATILVGQVNYAAIAAGQTVELTGYKFIAQSSGSLPDFIEFLLNITAAGNYSHADNFYLDLWNPVLTLGTRKVTDVNDVVVTTFPPNQNFLLDITLNNNGNFATGILSATLESPLTANGTLEFVMPNSSYDDIHALDSKTNLSHFVFKFNAPYAGAIPMVLKVTNQFGSQFTFNFNLNEPLPPLITNFHFTSTSDQISLMWDPISNIQGYNIYRSDQENGIYTKQNDFPVTGSSFYQDTDMPDLASIFYYKISVISSTGYERPLIQVVTNGNPPKQGYIAWTSMDNHGGFPTGDASGNWCTSSPALYDVDGDGNKEIFLNSETGATDGTIWGYYQSAQEMYNIDGNETTVSGFATTGIGMRSNPAVGDLDNDGHAEVVSVGRNNETNQGRVIVYRTTDADGNNQPDNFWTDGPINVGHKAVRNPVLYDVDKDGFLDIIIVDEKQTVYVYDRNKNLLPGWPVQVGNTDYSEGEIAVADIDHDGKAEIALGCQKVNGTKGGIYIWNHDGTPYTVNPFKEFANNERADGGVVFADIDNDFNLDVLVTTKKTGISNSGRIYAFKLDGTPVNAAWNGSFAYNTKVGQYYEHSMPRIAVGDLNHDGNLEIVFGSTDKLFLLNKDGVNFTGFPKSIGDIQESAPSLADIDTDDDIEIIINNYGVVKAYNYNGTECIGFPLESTTGFKFAGSVSVADIDNDGDNEMAIASENSMMFVYDTAGDSDKIEWGSYRGNPHNTGTYKEVCNVPLDLYIKDSADDTGAEPNAVTQYMWTSDNIWVRNNDDEGLEHQNPEYGAPNYVKVRVINKSCVASTGEETLSMYWAKASAYLSWPNPWNGGVSYPGSGASMGEYFGTLNIPVLQPGQEMILTFPWEMPDPALYGDSGDQWHFCLLAEINADGDPLGDLTSDLNANVRNNNNQAWKNVTVVDVLPNNSGDSVSGVIAVGNSTETTQVFTLEMLVHALEAADHPIYEDAEVTLEMDDVVFGAWVKGHKRTRFLDPGPKNNIRIVKGNNALLNNLSFEPNEFGTVKFSFHFLTKKITSEKNNYVFNVIQKDFRTQDIIGGERFEINKTERSPFRADAGGDKEVDWNQPITISAEDIGEPALYNWYDSKGALIFEGKELQIANAVAENYKLEVISTVDGYKDYADVEVKLKPNRLESISPNPASNNINVNYKLSDAQSAYLMIVSYYINGGVSNNYVLDLHSSQTNINISNYPYGFYKVVLVVNGQVVDAKLLFKQ